MGQDSWQAEQRKPYFLANAGRAFAGWLQVSTTGTRTKAKESRDIAEFIKLRRRERLNTRIAGLLGEIESKSVFEKRISHKAQSDFLCLWQMRTPHIRRKRYYHRTARNPTTAQLKSSSGFLTKFLHRLFVGQNP
jgi:hypothetical protein